MTKLFIDSDIILDLLLKRKNLRMLRNLLSILAITEKIVDDALREDTADFEDALQYIAAEKNGMDFIITRNKDDFKKSKLTVLSPRELLDIGIV